MRIRTQTGTAAVLGALALFTATADAADLAGPRGYAPQPVAPRLDLERWTGFYLGAALGGSFGDTDVSGSFGAGSIGNNGWNGALIAGYNWQMDRLILGVETDLGTGSFGGSTANGFDRYGLNFNAFGSFRGRLGYLMSPNLMVYATAGYAWANTDISRDGFNETRQFMHGYQLGLGTELAMTRATTLRLEYLYTDLGERSLVHGGQVNSFDTTYHTLRAGLTFRF